MKTGESLVDTHAHLAFDKLYSDLGNAIQRARECGVSKIINIASGAGIEGLRRSVSIASEYDCVYNSLGVHPNEVDEIHSASIAEIEAFFDNKKTVAVGEIGLDRYRSKGNLKLQKEVFRNFLKTAKKKDLPVVIHQRDAFEEVVALLKEEKIPGSVPFVFHCFSGSIEEAQTVVDLDGYVSITGIITFKNAKVLRETVANIPLERIMLETDSPYLAPEPKRGKRNEPSYLIFIADETARIKNIPVGEVAKITTQNAIECFRL